MYVYVYVTSFSVLTLSALSYCTFLTLLTYIRNILPTYFIQLLNCIINNKAMYKTCLSHKFYNKYPSRVKRNNKGRRPLRRSEAQRPKRNVRRPLFGDMSDAWPPRFDLVGDDLEC